MKKNLFKTAFMATFALMGAVLMSCGGSSSNSGKTLPTDGPFGEIPQLCSDYQDIQDKYTSGALNFEKDAMKKLTEAYDEYAEAFKAKAETMQGVEIKTEFAGDYPFKITKPFTITPFPGSKKFYSTGSFGSPADFSFEDGTACRLFFRQLSPPRFRRPPPLSIPLFCRRFRLKQASPPFPLFRTRTGLGIFRSRT